MTQYIQVPGTDTLIAREETFKGKTWDNTHCALADNGLFMPSLALFTCHFLNVGDAAQGITILYDEDNNKIPAEEARDLWNYLSSQERLSNCWTWLDAKFEQRPDGLYLLTDHKVIDNKLQPQTTEKLEDHVTKDCYVDLIFNEQGLPTQKSKRQEYEQGSTIYFWHPRTESVARFGAGSYGAYLNCARDPALSGPGLGVFAARKFSKDSTP